MRKKLFAVIMSVMMMVTFMPAMAFAAAGDATWASDYSGVTLSDGTFLKATKSFNTTTGMMDVEAGAYKASYYDFTNASIVGVSNLPADTYLKMINQDSKVKAPKFNGSFTYKNLLGGQIEFVNPKDSDVVVDVSASAIAQLDIDVELQRYEAYEKDSLTFPVTFSMKASNENDAEKTSSGTVAGMINLDKAVKNHKINLTFATLNNISYTMEGYDGEQTLNNNSLWTSYCGAEQKLTLVTKGITVEYSNDLGKTWTYTPSFTSADADPGYSFMYRVKKGSKEYTAQTMKVVVDPAELKLVFKKANFNFLPGTKVTASDIFELKTTRYSFDTKDTTTEDIYAADKATADKIFAECVVLNDKFPTQDSYNTIYNDEKTVDKKALLKVKELENTDLGVAEFFGNYDRTNILGNETAYVNYGVDYNDVTAPNQTKTYHVKKAAKLKSTKYFQLKATADYGTMSFTKMSGTSKIKVASNGKVTVKKGLKKGTYTVKVKVKAPGAKATKKLTVKVKY